jgi:uncharacterized protein (TIGR03086 family)
MENGHTTNATSQLERAFISTRAILAEVQPDQLEKSTPCTSWDVRTLIDHFVGSARWGATTLGWEEEILRSDPDSDFLIAYDAIIDAALAAFGAEGALEQTMELPMGVLSGGDVLAIVTRDQFVHGWDLARALDQGTDLDPELAEALLTQAKVGVPDDMRGSGEGAIFGAIVDASAGATSADRLAAFLGRQK